METTTSYYHNHSYVQNGTSNDDVPMECYRRIDSTGLFDFIVYGILINFIGLFGILGNTISIIVLSRPQMKSSINYLLIGLASCDTLLIICSVSRKLLLINVTILNIILDVVTSIIDLIDNERRRDLNAYDFITTIDRQ